MRGMRTRKHAMVLVLPTTIQPHAQRLVAAMQRAVCEYVSMAQWMQPDVSGAGATPTNLNARETTRHGLEATRLLLSLNVLLPSGHAGEMVEMARAITISGKANQVPRQFAQMLEVELKKWRRLCAGRVSDSTETVEDAPSQCGAFLRLLDELASQQFLVSVITPADALPFGGVAGDASALIATLQEQVKIEFIMLRDEEEQSGVSSTNVLQLLRGIKSSSNRNCSIRQLEECEIELQGVVKEWLHAAAPVVSASLQLGANDEQDKELELEIRANFVLVRAANSPASSWIALNSALSSLEFHHFVPLKSVHPAMLLGCPLRANPITQHLPRGQAFSHHLRERRYGGLVACTMMDGVQDFYLVVNSPRSDVSSELLMYRVASAEEVLLPEPGISEISFQLQPNDSDVITNELANLQKLPIQDFNAFQNRSGILDVALAQLRDPISRAVGKRFPATKPSSNIGPLRTTLTIAHDAPSRGPTTTKKKRRL